MARLHALMRSSLPLLIAVAACTAESADRNAERSPSSARHVDGGAGLPSGVVGSGAGPASGAAQVVGDASTVGDAVSDAAAPLQSIDDVISDMRDPPSANARNNNHASVIFSGNYDQAVKLAPQYAASFNNITSWCWAFEVEGNPATNTAVEVRRHVVYALRKSTNAWVKVDGGRPSGFRGNRGASTNTFSDEVVVDEETVRVHPGGPPHEDLVSYELWQPNTARMIDFVSDIKAVFAKCEMRLVRLNASEPEDIDTAAYAGQTGFDFWRRGAGPFEPGVTQFWGPNGRMKPVTRNWQAFSVITFKPGDLEWSDLPGELGFGPAWTVQNPYLDPPDTLSEAELRANPPPLE